MGSIISSITIPKLAVAPQSEVQCKDCSGLRKTDSDGFIIQLWFLDQEYSEQQNLERDKMKRAAGRSDRAFIDDLQNDRIINRELGSEVFREYVKKAVEARMEFNRRLNEAGIANPNGGKAKVTNVLDSNMDTEESELNQWMTESETSENLLSPSSETNEAAATALRMTSVQSLHLPWINFISLQSNSKNGSSRWILHSSEVHCGGHFTSDRYN
ncbi:hypothetical protein GE061_014914 [Apolygus lucorum]|uniref:Uncharacterized protein n=1 Tax=Apolygus lucorum TaxID=248454 RepID=A0A8S9XKM4_APOLU|nr:hypothetical protein GE061_014914 [Apolygus lucorum]